MIPPVMVVFADVKTNYHYYSLIYGTKSFVGSYCVYYLVLLFVFIQIFTANPSLIGKQPHVEA
jgi:hypothetical protein